MAGQTEWSYLGTSTPGTRRSVPTCQFAIVSKDGAGRETSRRIALLPRKDVAKSLRRDRDVMPEPQQEAFQDALRGVPGYDGGKARVPGCDHLVG